MFTRGRRKVAVPEVGADAPEFNLPSAQGGQLRLSMRTARGPVVVVFFRGLWSEEDVEYFQALAAKEDEINLAAASVVGIGLVEPDESREFVRASGIKSMVLYDYVRVTTRQWGLLEKDKEHGEGNYKATQDSNERTKKFVDSGKVARDWGGLTLTDLRWGYGIGARLHTSKQMLARIDLATGGSEGVRVFVRAGPSF